MTIFDTGIRPAIDAYLQKKSEEKRSYGQYWSASSAGYCMRKLIFERLGVPPVEKDTDARKQRVFTAGHIFHEWVQRITKDTGLSVAQELELQDEELKVRGHIDDLVLIADSTITYPVYTDKGKVGDETVTVHTGADIATEDAQQRLILYDYKTQNSNAFTWQKDRPASYYHTMQVGTYMYMLRQTAQTWNSVKEARILKISKDDLRMAENQILWTPELEATVKLYWDTLNGYWAAQKIPACSCHVHENGFLAKQEYNPYFFNGEPCSIELYQQWKLSKEKETV